MANYPPSWRINITRGALWSKAQTDPHAKCHKANLRRPQEIHNLVRADHSLPDSPHEIHLDHEQSDIAADLSSPVFSKPLSDRQAETLSEATEPSLPPTLETRKKKKKTDSPSPITESIAQSEIPSPKIEAPQPMKSGSKRKFSPDDDGFLSDTAPEDDEFQFSRPSHSPSKQTEPFDFMRQDFSPSKTPVNMKRGSSNSTASRRKVLEPSMRYNFPLPIEIMYSLIDRVKQRAQMPTWAPPRRLEQLFIPTTRCCRKREEMRISSLQ
jgi:hypothetical protein